MDTVTCIQRAIDFIEDNILEDLKVEVIANQAYMSSFQFQRVFAAVCNITLGNYIRNRRLSLAGMEISSAKGMIIDIAYKYGYESPESFSRAFTRFHGISPLIARNHGGNITLFTKLSVQSILGGEQIMKDLQERGYSVKENGPVYYTEDMDRTAKWFENVLGWYVTIDERNKDGKGLYGCALPIPQELLNMKISTFNGIHMFLENLSNKQWHLCEWKELSNYILLLRKVVGSKLPTLKRSIGAEKNVMLLQLMEVL